MIRADDALYEGLHVRGMLAALLTSAKPYLQGLRNQITWIQVISSEKEGPSSADLLEVPDLGSSRFEI